MLRRSTILALLLPLPIATLPLFAIAAGFVHPSEAKIVTVSASAASQPLRVELVGRPRSASARATPPIPAVRHCLLVETSPAQG